MQVRELMTENPACCTLETNLQQVAQMMIDHDCGAIPVVESEASKKPLGIVTDRDITTRLVAKGRNPLEAGIRDAMTETILSVTPDTAVEEAMQRMEQNQVRRLVVIGDDGSCVGLVSQADLARAVPEGDTGELVEKISQPNEKASGATKA